jgi:uncharacterized protein (DUF1778 family)
MPKVNVNDTARFDARIPREQKELFEEAAYHGGFRTLTDFIIIAAQEKANRIIEERKAIVVSEEDRKIFFAAIMNPAKPSSRLKKAADVYKKLLSA